MSCHNLITVILIYFLIAVNLSSANISLKTRFFIAKHWFLLSWRGGMKDFLPPIIFGKVIREGDKALKILMMLLSMAASSIREQGGRIKILFLLAKIITFDLLLRNKNFERTHKIQWSICLLWELRGKKLYISFPEVLYSPYFNITECQDPDST